MKKNIIDFNEYKEYKEHKNKKENNIKLFEKLVTKSLTELDLDELNIYSEIQPACSFMYKNQYKIIIAEFRDILFVINYLGDSKFEYLGTMDEILDVYIGSTK